MERQRSDARGITGQSLLPILVALLGWAAVASVLFTQDHGVASAATLVPAGISVVLVGVFLAGPVMARCPRCQRSAPSEPHHIHIERPPRDYFSPYSCCAGTNTNRGGDDDDCRTY